MEATYLKEVEAELRKSVVEKSAGRMFGPAKANEKLLAICSHKAQVILTLIQKLTADLGDREACLEATDRKTDQRGYDRWSGEAYLISQKIKLLNSLLWIQIHEDYPELLSVGKLGLRDDWKIVARPEEDDPVHKLAHSILRMVMNPNNVCNGKN